MSNDEVYPIFDFNSNYNLIKITHPTDNVEEISLMRIIGSPQHIHSRVVVGYRIVNTTFIAMPSFHKYLFTHSRHPEVLREEPNQRGPLLSYIDYVLMEKNELTLEDCIRWNHEPGAKKRDSRMKERSKEFDALKHICEYVDVFKAYIHSVRSIETITVKDTLKRLDKNIVRTGTILLMILLMVIVYICFLIKDRL